MTPTTAAMKAVESQTPATAKTTTPTTHPNEFFTRVNRRNGGKNVKKSLRCAGAPFADLLDVIDYAGPNVAIGEIKEAADFVYKELSAATTGPEKMLALVDKLSDLYLSVTELPWYSTRDQKPFANLMTEYAWQAYTAIHRDETTKGALQPGVAKAALGRLIDLLNVFKIHEDLNYVGQARELIKLFRAKVGRLYVQKVMVPPGPVLNPYRMLAVDYLACMSEQAKGEAVPAGYVVMYEWEGQLCIGASCADYGERYMGKYHRTNHIWKAIRHSVCPAMRAQKTYTLNSTHQRLTAMQAAGHDPGEVTIGTVDVPETPQQLCKRVNWPHNLSALTGMYLATRVQIDHDRQQALEAKETAASKHLGTTAITTEETPAASAEPPADASEDAGAAATKETASTVSE